MPKMAKISADEYFVCAGETLKDKLAQCNVLLSFQGLNVGDETTDHSHTLRFSISISAGTSRVNRSSLAVVKVNFIFVVCMNQYSPFSG